MRTEGSKNRGTPERRKALLEGALTLFVTRGFDQTSMDAICAHAGVTKGSVYHHFASKEALAATLYAEAVADIHQVVQHALRHARGAREGVEQLVRAYLGWFSKHKQLGTFVFRVMDGRMLDAHISTVRDAQVAFETQTVAWLADAIQAGEVSAQLPTLIVALVIGPARDFLRRWLAHTRPAEMREAMATLPIAAWKAVARDGP